jgi:hypothetical protein
MRRKKLVGVAAALVALALSGQSGRLRAQAAETGPKVGDMAPDFSLAGATRYGILRV